MSHVLIVGAGPAGLAAAEVLARAGVRVTLAERQEQAGGMPLSCGHSPFGWREFRRILSGKAYAARLIDRATEAGAEVRLAKSVAQIDAQGRVTLTSDAGLQDLAPDLILLATGAREATRAERLLPGDRPLGVLTTGSLQDLWFRRGAVPFRRPVILGSEMVSMSAILTCRQAGAPPVALLEPGEALVARAPFRWLPRALGLPVHRGVTLTDLVARDGRLRALHFTDARGRAQEVEADGLVLTGRFRPESGLARLSGLEIDPFTQGPRVDALGRTSHSRVFAAGNALRGVETAGWCWAEGRAVARAMITHLQSPLPDGPALHLGPGLAWAMPQRLAPKPALELQLRASAAIRGRLIARDAQGAIRLTLQVTTAPERRILLPMAPLLALDQPLTLSLEAE